MSLFKISRGSETNLPSQKTDGWAYFCTDTGSFWIDHKDANDTLVRSKISANFADKLRYVEDGETVELNPSEIATNTYVDNVAKTKADKSQGIFYIEGGGTIDTTNKVSAWTGSHEDITEYFDGLTIAYKIGVAGNSKTTLNINNLGAIQVRKGTSAFTTHLQVNTVVHLTYTTVSGVGYWVWADYDSGNTKVTQTQSSTATGQYGVLLSYYTNDSTNTTAQSVRRDNNFYYQPSTGTLTVSNVVGDLTGDVTGNASTATKATQDASGNTITVTYETKNDASSKLSDAKTYTDNQIINAINDIEFPVESVNGQTGEVHLTADDVFARPDDWMPELYDFGIEATAEELNYAQGVTAPIQPQIDGKADTDHTHDVIYLDSKSAQLPFSHDWSAITYGDGTYVAVASGYNNKAAYSTDGVTWTQTTLPSYESWVDVAYGDGVFVAIAGDSSSVAAYSTDGITWTQRLMPNALNWTAVTYGNGMFLAVAHSSTIGALGFGGSSWQSTYLPDSLGWSDVTFDGSQYIVVTDDGNTIARSSNGFSWSTSSYSAMSEGITAVAAAQGQSKYVGLGTSMSEIFYYSTNGSYWTHAYVTSGDWRDVVYGNDKFVAVAYGTNMASYSVDGSSWTNVTLPITANWTGITYGDGMFVAVVEGSTICAFSYDGITWMRSETNLLDKNGNDVSNQIAALVNTINAPKTTTVTLSASGWSGSSNPWSQVVNINGVTANSKVDLQPTASQIVELQNADIMLMVENDNGTTTVYAIGGKPTKAYTMQALITEVVPV